MGSQAIEYVGARQLSLLGTADKVAVYARVAGSAEPGSLEPQVAAVRQYVVNLGFQVVEVFADEGVSANVPMEERPQGKRLLEAARRGLFTHVVVYDLDRIGRDVQSVAKLIGDLDEAGVILHSVHKASHMADVLKVLPKGEQPRRRRKGS